jgi:hypothetical protein
MIIASSGPPAANPPFGSRGTDAGADVVVERLVQPIGGALFSGAIRAT